MMPRSASEALFISSSVSNTAPAGNPGLTNDPHRLFPGLLARPGDDDLIGVASAIWPEIWMRAFSADPAVIGTGVAYLKTVGPFFGFASAREPSAWSGRS
jgi:hypothetical protein